MLITGAANNTIGGTTVGARNVLSGNGGDGVELAGAGASNNVVAGNFIGTDASGLLDRGNNGEGVFLNGAPGNAVGGASPAARNIMSGNGGDGVGISGTASTNNQVLNNYIGTDASGTLSIGNSSHGVLFTSGAPSGNFVGNTNQGGNTIAFNNGDGIYVNVGTNNSLRANNIFSNNGLGIDLGANGVQANDGGDSNSGANQLQNYPLLTGAVADPADTMIQGALNSRPGTAYQLDFFSNITGDSSGFGEGQKWLGSAQVTTDAASNAVFNITISNVVFGRFISATATDPNGNTSEFSPWVRASSTIPPQTFTVINTNNSGSGSLRQALLDNNNAVSSGNNRVEFAIPGAGPHTISPASVLLAPTEAVTIDGYTQPGAFENTLANGNNAVLKIRLDGASAGFNTDGFQLSAIGGNVVRGLAILRFPSDGIELGTNGNNRIEGNFIGNDVDGTTQMPNSIYGININNSPGNMIGGVTAAARNVISGNNFHGIILVNPNSTNNLVQGNLIGTDSTGTADRGNSGSGIYIDASANIIGGTNALARNVISGYSGDGISLTGTSERNVVQGNLIGTDASGNAAIGNSNDGINVSLSTFTRTGNNSIGGTNSGAGNLIAFNFSRGVGISGGTNTAVRANNIFSNSGLGINLGFDSTVTPNDAGDSDTGANGMQNFPLLSSATITPANTSIQGTLNSAPNTTFQIDFFANVFADASGNGEGQQYLGSASAVTAANSNANFSVTLPAVAIGRQLTATATDPFGNTSEFSPVFAALSTFVPVTFVVTNTLDSGPGSLRQAILNNNATATATNNLISFNIAGAGPHTIAPASALPTISEPATIDGFTQPGSSSNSLANGNNAVWKIRLTGTNAGFSTRGLTFNSPSNIVRDLVVNGFFSSGIELTTPGNLVVGNLIGLETDSALRANGAYGIYVTSAGNGIGGTTPSARNVTSGNNSDGILCIGASATNNRVKGNFIGTDISGTLDRGNAGAGVNLFGGNNTVGGVVAGARNVISGNNGPGVNINFQGDNSVVQGNLIGTDVTGTGAVANGSSGVAVSQATNILVGGTTSATRNLISGNFQNGVQLSFGASGARVLGNYIGTDISGGASLQNFGLGVSIDANGAIVGGTAPGEGNIIAFNNAGIRVGSGTNNAIRANAIFGNFGLGINLGFDGATPNDAGDTDGGANFLQNFPVITNALQTSSNLIVQGTLNSRSNTTYRIDVYANVDCDLSGNGEGRHWLGSVMATTGAEGNAAFNGGVLAPPEGRMVTATATHHSDWMCTEGARRGDSELADLKQSDRDTCR